MTTLVEIATTDNAFFKPLEVPLPLTHGTLLDAARKKFKHVSKQSRLYDAISGDEVKANGAEVELAPGAKIIVSGKAGWKGAEHLRAERAARELPAAAPGDDLSASGDREPPSSGARRAMPLLRLQLVSFAYDQGQPRGTVANINARGLPNPGKAAMGRTGLDKRLAREVLASQTQIPHPTLNLTASPLNSPKTQGSTATLPPPSTQVLASPGAAELCERVVQEVLRQIQIHAAAADYTAGADVDASEPPLLRVGVGCDRGLHRSVALAEAATARLVRKAEHARSGRNSPGLEVLLQRVQLVDVEHRELVARCRRPATGSGAHEEMWLSDDEEEGSVDRRAELRIVGGV